MFKHFRQSKNEKEKTSLLEKPFDYRNNMSKADAKSYKKLLDVCAKDLLDKSGNIKDPSYTDFVNQLDSLFKRASNNNSITPDIRNCFATHIDKLTFTSSILYEAFSLFSKEMLLDLDKQRKPNHDALQTALGLAAMTETSNETPDDGIKHAKILLAPYTTQPTVKNQLT